MGVTFFLFAIIMTDRSTMMMAWLVVLCLFQL